MTHIRKAVRDEAVTALTGLSTTGTHAFSGRLSPLSDDEMPGLVVYPNADDARPDGYENGPTEMRSADLVIEAVAQGNDDLIDTLDQIAVEIEQALFGVAGQDFRALLMVDPLPPDTRIMIEEPDGGGGARRQGSISLRFPIMYRTPLGDPDINAGLVGLDFSRAANSMYVALI